MQRKFVIGDIHGCFDELMMLIQKIGLKDDDLLISLGDVVDRGGKSLQVVNYLSSRPNTIVLIGNHERKHLNGVLSYAQEIVKVQFGENYPAFLEWIKTFGCYIETDEAIIVHAAIEHDKPLTTQKEEVLCGATAGERTLEKKYTEGTFWTDYYTGEKPVIYGHHVVGPTPLVKNNTYGIDTGACHGGYLTAIELPGFVVHQVKAAADYWPLEQKKWQLPVLAAKNWLETDFITITKWLDKLSFSEDTAVKQLLASISKWVSDLQTQLISIKNALDDFTKTLISCFPDSFNAEAGKFEFRTFLFKSKANNLTLADLKKSLNTPLKIMTLAAKLNLEPIPPFSIPTNDGA